MDYKKYSLEQLDNWLNDVLNCEDLTAQEIYDLVVGVVRNSVEYHEREYNKTKRLLDLLSSSTKDKEREYNLREVEYYNKRAQLDAEYSKKNVATRKDWDDFWENSDTISPSDC